MRCTKNVKKNIAVHKTASDAIWVRARKIVLVERDPAAAARSKLKFLP
jgi:hypothetical protein